MPSADRNERLTDVAEWYYRDGLTQQQIADRTGITRTTISRMLSEARQRGIVEISIHRPLGTDSSLGHAMAARYPQLRSATVVIAPHRRERLHEQLGRAGAAVLRDALVDDVIVGITWGRSLAATAAAMPFEAMRGVTIVQLAGAVAAGSGAPHLIMKQLADKLGAETVALNAPLVLESPAMAEALIADPSNRTAIELGSSASVALIGVGTTDEHNASLVAGGHLRRGDMRSLARSGAVGEAGGHPIGGRGEAVCDEFARRLVSVPRAAMLAIPTRIGIAGGAAKAGAIRAAVLGGFVTHLVTDSTVAEHLLSSSAP